MTRSGRAALGAFLVLVAAAAFLLAADALRWRGHLAGAAAVYATGSPDPGIWVAEGWLPGRPVERLLDVDDDVAFGRALQQFRLARNRTRTGNPGIEGKQLVSTVEFELAKLIRAERDPVRRSQLLTLASVMLFEGAQSQGVPGETFLLRTYEQLREAASLDAANGEARENLELLVRTALPTLLVGRSAGDTGGRSATPGSSGAAQVGDGW